MFFAHYLIVMIILSCNYYKLPTADFLQHAHTGLHESNQCWSLANDDFDFIECFTFLHTHSWLNWVDEDD